MNEKDKALAKFDRLVKARKMVNLNVLETSGVDTPAHGEKGWAVIKADSNPLDNPRSPEAVKARLEAFTAKLEERKKLARQRSQRAETQRQALKPAKPMPPAKPEEKVTKMTAEPQTAQDRIMAEATRLWQEGRVTSVAQGVVMATTFDPQLADEAIGETINAGNENGRV